MCHFVELLSLPVFDEYEVLALWIMPFLFYVEDELKTVRTVKQSIFWHSLDEIL